MAGAPSFTCATATPDAIGRPRYQPTLRKADHYEAIFVQARAEYRRRDQAIEAHTEISVSPEDDVEIRRVTLTNQSSRTRHIEVTSYAEVVLAPLNADLAHRAFSNLFVQTEILPEHGRRSSARGVAAHRGSRCRGCFTCWPRRARSADEPSYETDRARFIGRGRTAANPVALDEHRQPVTVCRTPTGPVLDPIVAIRRTLTLSPDESATVQIISGVARHARGRIGLAREIL